MKQWPTLVRVLFPRNPAPLPPGRFSVLPVDSHHFLLADAASHQVLLANHRSRRAAGALRPGGAAGANFFGGAVWGVFRENANCGNPVG